MAKRQRLTLQQVLDEIFINTLSENDKEDHLEEDYSDSAKYSPELDKAVPNEVTNTHTVIASRFIQLKIIVSALVKLIVRDFVVHAAVFQAVLLFFLATF